MAKTGHRGAGAKHERAKLLLLCRGSESVRSSFREKPALADEVSGRLAAVDPETGCRVPRHGRDDAGNGGDGRQAAIPHDFNAGRERHWREARRAVGATFDTAAVAFQEDNIAGA